MLTDYSMAYAFWVTWSEQVLDTSPKWNEPRRPRKTPYRDYTSVPLSLITCATVGPHRIHYFSNDFHLADFLFCSPYKPTIIEHPLHYFYPNTNYNCSFLLLWITPANSILSSDLYFLKPHNVMPFQSFHAFITSLSTMTNILFLLQCWQYHSHRGRKYAFECQIPPLILAKN